MTDYQRETRIPRDVPGNLSGHEGLKRLLPGLSGALGERLVAVVLYGSSARGGSAGAPPRDVNLVVVVDRLDVEALEAMTPALTDWTRSGQALPRLLSPDLIAESADVFPIEYHDLRGCGIALTGTNPFADLRIAREPLRLQCERELREKMMRLREGFVLSRGKPKEIARLMAGSWGTFVALFRGCLHLAGEAIPDDDVDVVAAFSHIAGIDRSVLLEVANLREHGRHADARGLFLRYYRQLEEAVSRVNRFHQGERE